MDYLQEWTKSLQEFLSTYIDLDYSLWLYRLLWPLIVTFLLPLVFVALIYISFVMLFIYKLHREVIMRTVRTDRKFWEFGRKLVAALWDAHARIYHGYEVIGMENIPETGPALIVYYHGAIPIDMYYLNSRIILQKDRLIYTIGDRFLFKLPGWGTISEAFHVSPGTVQSCVGILKEGNLLAISPGGVYEAQFGDQYYELLWRNRVGFAKVALEAKVPIIPCFTQNLREGFRQLGIFRNFFMKLYNTVRIPVYPIYGGFPVKFRTFVGRPIAYDGTLTPEELQMKVASALEELINQHQRIPGSIFHALLDRIPSLRTKRKVPE
ncbi:PREDICTED: transmembrane protein 68 [Rhagoletis zephyria]|uniref:transmembrane protein 68 n=2 Tax=Rhagoletis zephyria TaxID=28612 RepID=UPI000811A9C5|nr:PREDICTED: transmembrane protein 68 [Rhagoletis zephyria]XP_017466377.1 PREDICTED: transmembrane protein 68 [Rhagoletis zephyria]